MKEEITLADMDKAAEECLDEMLTTAQIVDTEEFKALEAVIAAAKRVTAVLNRDGIIYDYEVEAEELFKAVENLQKVKGGGG